MSDRSGHRKSVVARQKIPECDDHWSVERVGLRKSSTRDPAAGVHPLAVVFETNIDAVFGYTLVRCGSRHVAEEVVAETFAEAARAYQHGRGHEIERGWLLHVARLRLIDYWRRESRQSRRAERLAVMTLRDHVLPDAADGDPHVLAALDSLSARQRAVLTLRYVDDYSVSEVAEAMGMSYPATESLLARARRALLAAYTAEGGSRP